MKFQKVYSYSLNDRFSPSGDVMRPVYEEVVDQAGYKQLNISTYDNLQEIHDSFLQETDIYNILRRCNNDPSILNDLYPATGAYLDLLDAPVSFADAINRRFDLERKFNSMPADLRSRFGNDLNVFLTQLSSGIGEKVISSYVEDHKDKFIKFDNSSEVKTNE